MARPTDRPTAPTAPVEDGRQPILKVRDITKRFPGVLALDRVSFDVYPGEVHALIGENGAGKSTLMKVLAGKYRPDSGEMLFQGDSVTFHSPFDARIKGILLIHQELSLVPELSVAENVFLGSLPVSRASHVDWKLMFERVDVILKELKCGFEPTTRVGDLSIAQQQMVEIARALAFRSTVVIFDEPTASLTDHEQRVLFESIERLREDNVAIIYISHRMSEIFEIANRITVLRDGQVRGTLPTAETDEDQVTQLMIGRALSDYYEKGERRLGEEVLRVENLTCKGVYEDVSFTLRAGEVLGFYGLIGAGRSEIAETLFGMRKADSGTVYFKGKPVAIGNSGDAVQLGIALVPENRKEQGLVLAMSGRENMTLPQIDRLQSWGFMRRHAEQAIFHRYREALAISTTGPHQRVETLSGGNQQKVVIGKWLSTEPVLLILDEPTRGIDVGSKSEIHKLIGELAEQGYAVVVISSEMPEIIGVSHRIVTMYSGRVTGEFRGDEITENNLIVAVSGLEA